MAGKVATPPPHLSGNMQVCVDLVLNPLHRQPASVNSDGWNTANKTKVVVFDSLMNPSSFFAFVLTIDHAMIPWRRKWQPTPVFLPDIFHGQRSLVGCSPWGCSQTRLNMHTKSHTDHAMLAQLVNFSLSFQGNSYI